MKKRDTFLIIGAASFLLLIVSITLLLGNKLKPQSCGCPHVISNNFIWIFILLATIFVSSLIYYLFSFKIDLKNRIISKNMEILFSILDEDEKAVLKKIINLNGEIDQSDLNGDYDKIKAHRILKKLEDKKIIEIRKNGKRNKISLKDELRGELL